MADRQDDARRTPPPNGSDDVLSRLGLTGSGATGATGGRAARRRAAEDAQRRHPNAEPSDRPTETSERAQTDSAHPGRAQTDRAQTDRAQTDQAPADRAQTSRDRVGPRPPAGTSGQDQRGRTGTDGPGPRRRMNAAGPAQRDAERTWRLGPDDLPTHILPITPGGPPPRGTLPRGPSRTTRRAGAPDAGPPFPDGRTRNGAPAPADGRERNGQGADPAGAARPPSRNGGLESAGRPDDPRGLAQPPSPNGTAAEARRIDETLTRMTFAHAGLTVDGKPDEPDEEQDDRPPRQRPSLLRLAVLAVAAVVVAASGIGWGAQRWLGGAIQSAAALDPGSGAIVDPGKQAGAENVLVVATDRAVTPGAAARPDTVVIAHLPAAAAKGAAGPLTVLSIPTDLEVSRPPCEHYDAASATYTAETVPAQARTQLATALDLGGPRCATRAVQQLTGLAITRYVGIDLERLGAAVGAVSGVRVCTPRAVVDATLGPVAPTPGSIVLDARQATDYASAAAVADDPPAGQGRIERQQQVLAAVLGSALSDTRLLNLPRLTALRPMLGQTLSTDGADLDQVLALARSLDDLGAAGVTFASVPTDPDPAGGSVLRTTDAGVVFDALRTDAALPATTAGQRSELKPSELHVQVSNASERPGLAAKIADTLRGLGFGVGAVTNADEPTPQTLIRYSPDQTGAAELLAATVPAATTVPDPGATGVLQLVLGRSFDGVVRAPTSAPAPTAAGTSPTPVNCG